MKITLLKWLLLSAVGVGILWNLLPGQGQPATKVVKNHLGLVPARLPASVYKEEAVINKWVAENDANNIKQHGWELWKEITATTDQKVHGVQVPLFETWYDRDEAFASPDKAKLPIQRRLKAPNQARIHEKARKDATLVSGVKYDPYLTDHIQKNKLYDPATLQQYLNKTMPVSPAQGVMIKAVYQIVAADTPTRLGYWAGPQATKIPTPTATPDTWNKLMLVMPPKVDGPIDAVDAKLPKVPLSRFYSFALTKEEAAAINAGHLIEGKPGIGIGRDAKAGDIAILVAMHVATREIENWTWQTFWWSFEKPEIPAAVKLAGPFDNYQMDVGYSFMKSDNSGPVICYNPYMETMFGSFPPYQPKLSGIQSNCMSCHRTAAWPKDAKSNSYIANGVIDPNDAVDFGRYFKDKVRTDFLWGLPDAIPAPK